MVAVGAAVVEAVVQAEVVVVVPAVPPVQLLLGLQEEILQIAIIVQVTHRQVPLIHQQEPIDLQLHIHMMDEMRKQLITQPLIRTVQHNIQHFTVLQLLLIITKLEEYQAQRGLDIKVITMVLITEIVTTVIDIMITDMIAIVQHLSDNYLVSLKQVVHSMGVLLLMIPVLALMQHRIWQILSIKAKHKLWLM